MSSKAAQLCCALPYARAHGRCPARRRAPPPARSSRPARASRGSPSPRPSRAVLGLLGRDGPAHHQRARRRAAGPTPVHGAHGPHARGGGARRALDRSAGRSQVAPGADRATVVPRWSANAGAGRTGSPRRSPRRSIRRRRRRSRPPCRCSPASWPGTSAARRRTDGAPVTVGHDVELNFPDGRGRRPCARRPAVGSGSSCFDLGSTSTARPVCGRPVGDEPTSSFDFEPGPRAGPSQPSFRRGRSRNDRDARGAAGSARPTASRACSAREGPDDCRRRPRPRHVSARCRPARKARRGAGLLSCRAIHEA